MSDWYRRAVETIASHFVTDLNQGLSDPEAQKRLAEFGPNQITEKKLTPLWFIFFGQFKDLMIIVLLVAALVSGLIGELKDAFMILLIVFLNAVLGASQEYRAERAVAALKKLTVPQVLVLRGGEVKKISTTALVPGDMVLLEAGSFVPADIRISAAPNLKVDESALTGESVPVEKVPEAIDKESLPISDQENMAFAGTIVTYGRGKGIVVATGMGTEVGKIAKMIEAEKEALSPLQKRFAELGKWLAGIALAICFVIFAAGIFRGELMMDMFLTAVSLAVAAIPEGLPAVIVISLALGAYRMAKRRAIIRKLPAVETLGCTTVICADKTGTLTQNLMTVQNVLPHKEERTLLLRAGALCNDATTKIGDPTEKALVIEAEGEGLEKAELERKYPRLSEIPFDSNRKMMTTFHKEPEGGFIAFSKGALEIILERTDISEEEKKKVMAENQQLVSEGQRVLGFSYKRFSERPAKLEEKDFTFLGLVSMLDPPRPEVYEAVKLCKGAGIRTIMITGDHRLTALAIARELGIKDSDVFARVSPGDKLKIVDDLKARGEVVAMTGDGVNDAPALKKADIGVAMGMVGTDVAREASDMVLTDDNFATIVSAVEEGRGIYDNIRKFIRYMLSTNAGEILTMFFSILLRFPLPLLPIHILWVNLVTDGLPAVALSAEPIEKDIMQRPPRDPKESVLAGGLLYSMAGIGILMAAGTLFLFYLNLNNGGILKARTAAFTVLSLLQMSHVLNCRSLDRSLFRIGIFSNIYLWVAVLLTLVLQVLVVYVPFLQYVFYTVPLAPIDWLLILAIALLPIAAVETRKLLFSRAG
jgi:Ca2+-transporting ATPase